MPHWNTGSQSSNPCPTPMPTTELSQEVCHAGSASLRVHVLNSAWMRAGELTNFIAYARLSATHERQ